jgi:hypothetical protein
MAQSQPSSQSPSQSRLISQYALVVVGYHWRDGAEIQEAKILRQEGSTYVVQTKKGTHHNVAISDIKNLINATARPLYVAGDTVCAQVDYHQFDGDIDDFCEILSVFVFCNDVDYRLKIIRTGEIRTVSQSSVKRRVALRAPKFAQGQRIGVKHCDGHPYFFDEYIKNAEIVSVQPWYDGVKYSVRYDDGIVATINEDIVTQPAVVKTAVQKQQEYTQFLQSEEQRLLEQLERVRAQMRH